MTQFKPLKIKQQTQATQARGISIPCPYCASRVRSYGKTVQMSERVQHRFMRCTNENCSASFQVQISIFKDIQPPVDMNSETE